MTWLGKKPAHYQPQYLPISPETFQFQHQKVWHIEAETILPPFRRRHFQMHFHEWKCMNFDNISMKFVPKVLINNIPALVQIMACRHPGGKPLSEQMMVSLLTHICVTLPQWVNITSIKKHAISLLRQNHTTEIHILKSLCKRDVKLQCLVTWVHLFLHEPMNIYMLTCMHPIC